MYNLSRETNTEIMHNCVNTSTPGAKGDQETDSNVFRAVLFKSCKFHTATR